MKPKGPAIGAQRIVQAGVAEPQRLWFMTGTVKAASGSCAALFVPLLGITCAITKSGSS